VTDLPMGSPIEHTPTVPYDPMTNTYTRFGAHFEPYEYTGWVDESVSWKETCYIGDWSSLLKVRVKGPDALRFFSEISINSMAVFPVGRAKHAVFTNDDGKVMGEGILMRWAEDELFFTSGPGTLWAMYRFQAGDYDAELTNLTDEMTIQQVQGPASLAVLEEATGESLRDIEFMHFRRSSIDGMEFLLLRQGMAGEVGYELHGKASEGVAVFQRIWEVGQAHGIRRLGGRTKMVNHVEACFPTPTVDYLPAWFGPDQEALRTWAQQNLWLPVERFAEHAGSLDPASLDELYFSPVELGWGKSIRFDHEFPGRDVLAAELAAPRRLIRTLVWNAEDVTDVFASLFADETPYEVMELPRELLGRVVADAVLVDGARVGVSMSRCYSYFFRKMLSLCVLDVAHADPGTEVEVVWGSPGSRQKVIRATVAPAPFKTDRRRTDLSVPGAVESRA
jgi:glycine cleavage system aminomethyltransferase T